MRFLTMTTYKSDHLLISIVVDIETNTVVIDFSEPFHVATNVEQSASDERQHRLNPHGLKLSTSNIIHLFRSDKLNFFKWYNIFSWFFLIMERLSITNPINTNPTKKRRDPPDRKPSHL